VRSGRAMDARRLLVYGNAAVGAGRKERAVGGTYIF